MTNAEYWKGHLSANDYRKYLAETPKRMRDAERILNEDDLAALVRGGGDSEKYALIHKLFEHHRAVIVGGDSFVQFAVKVEKALTES